MSGDELYQHICGFWSHLLVHCWSCCFHHSMPTSTPGTLINEHFFMEHSGLKASFNAALKCLLVSHCFTTHVQIGCIIGIFIHKPASLLSEPPLLLFCLLRRSHNKWRDGFIMHAFPFGFLLSTLFCSM